MLKRARIGAMIFLAVACVVAVAFVGRGNVGGGGGSRSLEVNVVKEFGRLQVKDGKIFGQNGKVASLAGNSFFWSQWIGQFYTPETVAWLKKDWGSSIVRVAIGVEPDGYLMNPEVEMKRAETVIDAAIHEGMYVIVDWHDHDAVKNEAAATDFFEKIARKYGKQPNLIYEIWNEPVGDVSWKDVVKPYSERVIAKIRAVDPDNLILVGSPFWCQAVDVAAADPVKDVNVAYSLHFYAGTHKADLRAKADKAMAMGAALFVSEYGTCNANGDGDVDYESMKEWADWMKKHQLSHCNWSIADKVEGTAALKPGASWTGGWKAEELTASGQYVRELIRGW